MPGPCLANKLGSFRCCLGFGWGVPRNFRCQVPDDKFLKQIGDGIFVNPDCCVFECQPHSIAILRWIVEIGNSSRRKVSEDIRVICLPASIVSLTDNCIHDRIHDPGWRATPAFVKITRILFKKRWQYGRSDERRRSHVSIAGSESFSITFRALPISSEVILRLLNSRSASHKYEGEWIHHRLPGKVELLLRVERHCIGEVADIKIWEVAEHALLLFNLDLLFCHFRAGKPDLYLRDTGSHRQRDLRDNVDLPRTQDSRGSLCIEARRRNGELKRSGSDVGQGKLTIAA